MVNSLRFRHGSTTATLIRCREHQERRVDRRDPPVLPDLPEVLDRQGLQDPPDLLVVMVRMVQQGLQVLRDHGEQQDRPGLRDLQGLRDQRVVKGLLDLPDLQDRPVVAVVVAMRLP